MAVEQVNDTVKNPVVLYIDTIAALGEGAIWNQKSAVYHWLDIEKGEVFTFDPQLDQIKIIDVGQRVGTIVPSSKDDIVLVALQNGIYKLNLETEELQLMEKAPFDPEVIRFNDGKCDPAGRFWVGSMALSEESNAAALYSFDGDSSIIQKLDSITISNGICWSADKKTMYYIDTPTQAVKAFDYNNETGAIENGRIIIKIEEENAFPDGMTIDSEGKLWIALWGGSSVVRYDPDNGQLLTRIPVPAKNVTSCAFGGSNLDTLLITTASIGMNDKEKSKYSKAGAVFATVPGVKGVGANFFEIKKD
ncbi:SMP-30/gluconolactonase/LRE family protein [Fulvivirga sp. 29W222]|uniref:SMP-30/gluconolactonase/LRE family protein n=2 Tax=Fulvivirga marina TaxID=2494733 RepID=A0A937FUM4_9BACT|nr:SMP-30/gluconolactonase/LRE family protein [Fulvivirga marina]